MFCQCFLFIYFLWPPYSPALVNGSSRKFYTWWTLSVIREVITWIFSWSSLNYRMGQKVTKFGVFSDPYPQTFCSHARTRQNIVILIKLVKHRWLLYTQCHISWTLVYKPLRSTRPFIVERPALAVRLDLSFRSVYFFLREYLPNRWTYLNKSLHGDGKWSGIEHGGFHFSIFWRGLGWGPKMSLFARICLEWPSQNTIWRQNGEWYQKSKTVLFWPDNFTT